MKVKHKNNQSIVNVLNSEVNEMSDGTMGLGRDASVMAQKHVERIGKSERKISWEMEEASAFRLANINRNASNRPFHHVITGKSFDVLDGDWSKRRLGRIFTTPLLP